MHTFAQHLLVATRNLQDPYFKNGVIYVCEHDEDGAMGLMINHPTSLTLAQLCEKSDAAVPLDAHGDAIVFDGGPVAQDRGFVLHSDDASFESTLPLQEGLSITTSKDVLSAFAAKDATPQHYLVALGYSGWSEGQLEQEIQENAWLTIPADLRLLFGTPIHRRWDQSISTLGIHAWQLSSDIGHG